MPVSASRSSSSPLVVGESTRLVEDGVAEPVPRGLRTGAWRSRKAFEAHAALTQVRAAAHAVDVCLGRLLRLMRESNGYRRWGTVSFGDYVTQDLRRPSVRRYEYLMAI